MPILDDIMDHDLLGPAIRRGIHATVLHQVEKRFGAVPAWAQQRLDAMSARELDQTAIRLLDARSFEDLLGS